MINFLIKALNKQLKSHFSLALYILPFFQIWNRLCTCVCVKIMIWNIKQKQQSICKQPLEWWIYATPFNSHTRKIGVERDSASPATNLTASHWCRRQYKLYCCF